MAATLIRNPPNPLLLPEIVEYVIDNICMGDLVSCTYVNSLWNVIALKKLYKGSLNDMQYRTPHIGRLGNLLIASRERFSQNMSFVKHLLLAPKTPTIDAAARPNTNRLACSEEFLPLRRRLDAERLLRPQGSGLVSLTIPFEIDEDWSLISDLLLSPTIKYLAVDNFYCELLMASSNRSAEPITPADKFSKLKIYRSESSRGNKLLFHLIRSCNLHFFHFEERSRDQMTPIEIAELSISLQRQQNLKALVLIIPGSSCSAAIRMARRKQSKLWPNLKALYLGMGDEHWLEQIPDFKELQILSIQEFVSGPRIINIRTSSGKYSSQKSS